MIHSDDRVTGAPPGTEGDLDVLYTIDSSPQQAQGGILAKLSKCRRVLLIEANDQRRWVGGRVAPEVHIPPVGLMYIASSARLHNPDVHIEILETSLDGRTDEELVAKLLDYRPDLVGIRSISLFEDELKRVAGLTRRVLDVPIVAGGPIATARRGAVLKAIPEIDLLVVGEGEWTFSRLLAGTPTNGLVLRQGEQTVDLGDGEAADNLDELPFPDYSLVDLGRYAEHLSYAYNHRRQGVLLTSRGCPFLCTYCNTFAGKTARLRSAENVVAEMEQMYRGHAIEDFYVVDDIFNMDRKRTAAIFRMIIGLRKNWRLYFVNGLRADIMTRELVDLMADAGTVWVTYAVESGSPRIQKLVKKNMHLAKAADIVNYSQDRGMVVNVNTMYGFPTETGAEAQQTLDYLARLHMPSLLPYHFCLRGYEGCEIVEQAAEAGWDTSAFLADGALSYHDMPTGTATFPRGEMMDHIIEYHRRFGMHNKPHLLRSLEVLKDNGYTDRDLVDMYSVLQNRPFHHVDEIVAGAAVGAKPAIC
ncbi:MAG TPA: radical SAM protein [Bryobacteraceae bacterium]|nr:radical SAM protein [Bryobacteraceae bacterium]